MNLSISIMVMVIVALTEIKGKSLDPGPQLFNDTSKLPPQSSQKRYATKEIILYLTPTQIRALQEGQGLISPQNIPQADVGKQAHGQIGHAPAAPHNYHDRLHHHLSHPPQASVLAPVEEPHSDQFVPIIPPPEYRHADNYAYINFQPPKNPHFPKPIPFFPNHQDQVTYGNKEISKLTSHDPHHEKTQDLLQEHLKDQWYNLLDHNRAHFKEHVALSQYNIQKANDHKKDFLQYAARHNEHKYNLEQEVNNNFQHQLEKQLSFLRSEDIANSPPLLVHKEINIKHSPVHLIKQIKVPVPTPVLIPIPEPFEVKVPQPYPVPLEIIKPVPIPIIKTQRVEVEKPFPVEIEKHIPFPVTKKVYVNVEKPYFLDPSTALPLPKSFSSPIHSHV